jgi:hypothetical protein
MQTESIKQKAHQLVDKLPDSASWEDVMYQIYVRQAMSGPFVPVLIGALLSIQAQLPIGFLRYLILSCICIFYYTSMYLLLNTNS